MSVGGCGCVCCAYVHECVCLTNVHACMYAHCVFLFPLQDNPNRFGMSENEAFFALAIKEHLAQPVAIPHNLVEYFLVQPNPSNPRQMQMFMELLHCESVLLRMHVRTYVCLYVRMYV